MKSGGRNAFFRGKIREKTLPSTRFVISNTLGIHTFPFSLGNHTAGGKLCKTIMATGESYLQAGPRLRGGVVCVLGCLDSSVVVDNLIRAVSLEEGGFCMRRKGLQLTAS